MIRNLISHINVMDYFKYPIHLSEDGTKLIIVSEMNESLHTELIQELLYKFLYLTDIDTEATFIDEYGDESKGTGYIFTHTHHFISSEI